MASEEVTPIWIFESEEGEQRACSKNVASYIKNKVSRIVMQTEIEGKKVATQNDIHAVLEYVMDEIRDKFCVCHGEDDDGKEFVYLDFDEKPEDFDRFVNTSSRE